MGHFIWIAHDLKQSPNTVGAYAHILKDYREFLCFRGFAWREVRSPGGGELLVWLRLPPAGRNGDVAVLPAVEPHLSAAAINRKLWALSPFYQHEVRHGVHSGKLLTTWQAPGRRGGWKPFLHHLTKLLPASARPIALKAPVKLPRVLTVGNVQAILDACTHLRDRFLFALLYDSGVRIGEALGLRHEDIAVAEQEITVVPRANDNPVRSKSRRQRTIPASAELIRLYRDYLNAEYGDLASDYVFVTLFAESRGHALSCPAVSSFSPMQRRPPRPGAR